LSQVVVLCSNAASDNLCTIHMCLTKKSIVDFFAEWTANFRTDEAKQATHKSECFFFLCVHCAFICEINDNFINVHGEWIYLHLNVFFTVILDFFVIMYVACCMYNVIFVFLLTLTRFHDWIRNSLTQFFFRMNNTFYVEVKTAYE
jgi:hypothetical protein